MISYLGSLVQFSPPAGRAGRCRQISSLGVGSTHRVPATLGLPRTGGVCAFPVYPAQAPGCSIWSGPCAECGSSFRVLHKSADLVAPAFCVFTGWSGSGSQELDGHTLLECGVPSHLRTSSLSFCVRQLGASGLCLFSGAGLQPQSSRWWMADVNHPESQGVFG